MSHCAKVGGLLALALSMVDWLRGLCVVKYRLCCLLVIRTDKKGAGEDVGDVVSLHI